MGAVATSTIFCCIPALKSIKKAICCIPANRCKCFVSRVEIDFLKLNRSFLFVIFRHNSSRRPLHIEEATVQRGSNDKILIRKFTVDGLGGWVLPKLLVSIICVSV